MSFRGWTRILPIWLIQRWARTFSSNWVEIKGKQYIAFSLYGDMTLIIDKKKYEAQEKPKEERENELYEKQKRKAETKLLEITNKYPELKDTYFQKEEENFDE